MQEIIHFNVRHYEYLSIKDKTFMLESLEKNPQIMNFFSNKTEVNLERPKMPIK